VQPVGQGEEAVALLRIVEVEDVARITRTVPMRAPSASSSSNEAIADDGGVPARRAASARARLARRQAARAIGSLNRDTGILWQIAGAPI